MRSSGIAGWPIPLGRLMGLPVRTSGRHASRVADVVLDRDRKHVLGFVVSDPDHERGFLPWAVARVEQDHVATKPGAALLSPDELRFYVGNGARLAVDLGEMNRVVDEGGEVVSTGDGDALHARVGEAG